MLKISSSMPAKREALLLGLLLASLLWISSNHFDIRRSWSTDTLESDFVGVDSGDKDILTADREQWRTHLSWSANANSIPQTNVVDHAPGWTIFDNLYVVNGTVYVVNDDPDAVPPRERITSAGIRVEPGDATFASRLPTDREMRIISTEEAKGLLGTSAEVIDGVTWLVNDPPQFITHYYHFSAELFFGFWRTYSSLDPTLPPSGRTALPTIRRIWFAHADSDHWRDYAHLNEWVLRSTFPSLTTEYVNDWNERAELGRLFILDRVVFSDRSAAMQGKNFKQTGRIASEATTLPGSLHWWSTIRTNVMKFAGVDEETLAGIADTPVITYISRQGWGRRMLKDEDHERLVKELHTLRDRHGYEVNIVSMDKLSRAEQIRLAARTTIMMGVHGNGLTSLVWMKPTPSATVIEFFYPGGFAHDYEYTTRSLGMKYYGVWGNETFTNPDLPRVAYPNGFQGNEIPVDGSVVAQLCHERINIESKDE